MHRLILVLEVEPIPENIVFQQWPLHCTLIYWFYYKGELATISKELKSFFKNFRPAELIAGEKALFGKNQKLPVNLVKNSSELQALHNASFDKLSQLGVRFTDEQFLRDGYRPHVTVHGGRSLVKGKKHLSKAVYLVKSTSEQPKERLVIKRMELVG